MYLFISFAAELSLLAESTSGANPEFPRWGRQPQRGMSTYYLAKFSWKLHANEEILTGGARPKF